MPARDMLEDMYFSVHSSRFYAILKMSVPHDPLFEIFEVATDWLQETNSPVQL